MKLGSKAKLSVSITPVFFQSPISYTDPQIFRLTDDLEPTGDYGEDLLDDDVFKDTTNPERD